MPEKISEPTNWKFPYVWATQEILGVLKFWLLFLANKSRASNLLEMWRLYRQILYFRTAQEFLVFIPT